MTASVFALDSVTLPARLLLAVGTLLTALWGIFTGSRGQKLNSAFWEGVVDFEVSFEKLSAFEQQYGNGKEIRMYGMRDGLCGLIQKLQTELWRKNRDMELRRSVLNASHEALNHLLRFGVYMMLLYIAMQEQITVGAIVQYVSCRLPASTTGI